MIKIMLSGEIGWDIYPEDIREQLKSAKGKDIEVHLVSPGGSVMDGIEIFNMFRDYKRENPESQNILLIKGMAASMATYISMCPCFDLVAAEDNAVFMIHNAWGVTHGDYREMRLFADILDGLTNIIGKEYARKTKIKIKEIREMMDAETWLFGSEMVDAGFVDEMIPSDNPKKKKSKADAMAMAKMTYGKLSDKMKTSDKNIDVHKIAAMLRPETMMDIASEKAKAELEKVRPKNDTTFNVNPDMIENIKKTHERIAINESFNAQIPAQKTRDNNITEVSSMTLAQLMAENPAAKIEFDAALTDKFNAGIKSGMETEQEKMKAVSSFLSPDSTYPNAVKKIAIEVLDGKNTVESLRTTASAFDALKEASASTEAAAETAAQGETPAEQNAPTSEDGTIKNEADFDAAIAHDMAATGRGV